MKPKFNFEIMQHLFDPNDRYNFQTNEDWLVLRRDRITASFAPELLVDGKSADGLGKTIKKMLAKRVMQRYTGWIDDEAMSWQERESVKRGIVYEQEAADWYSEVTGRKVVPCGFVERGKYLGCSPDRIVVETEEKRMLQIKIPMPENFIEKIVDNGHEEYIPQCKKELFVCDFDINDLVIYSPELRTGKIIEINRDFDIDRKILSKMRRAIQYQEKADIEICRLLKQNQKG